VLANLAGCHPDEIAHHVAGLSLTALMRVEGSEKAK